MKYPIKMSAKYNKLEDFFVKNQSRTGKLNKSYFGVFIQCERTTQTVGS